MSYQECPAPGRCQDAFHLKSESLIHSPFISFRYQNFQPLTEVRFTMALAAAVGVKYILPPNLILPRGVKRALYSFPL